MKIEDMKQYTHPVLHWIAKNNLPEGSFPEVYEFFVRELELPLQFVYGNFEFDFSGVDSSVISKFRNKIINGEKI